ncbi:MAG: hypothetical protein HC898_05675 [Phycisphaerales bacterium]|nr:hypothetical protein [Phycisphaerales bacterium]
MDLAPTPGLQTPKPYPALPGATINIGDPGTHNMLPADHSPTPYPAPYRNPSPVPPVPLPQANPLPGATVMQPFGNPPSAMSVQEQPMSVGTHGQVTPGPSLAQGEQAIGLFDPLPPQPTVSQYEPQPTGRGLDLGNSTKRP